MTVFIDDIRMFLKDRDYFLRSRNRFSLEYTMTDPADNSAEPAVRQGIHEMKGECTVTEPFHLLDNCGPKDLLDSHAVGAGCAACRTDIL